jgi:indolepyruvate decarboxylase
MLDGKFNDVHRWEYAKIPAVLNAGLGLKVNTEIEMEAALTQALANTDSFTLIQVMLARGDHSPALMRLTKTLAGRVAKAKG